MAFFHSKISKRLKKQKQKRKQKTTKQNKTNKQKTGAKTRHVTGSSFFNIPPMSYFT